MANGAGAAFHSHVFLGESHEKSERKTWAVIWLCTAMMIAEIGGGLVVRVNRVDRRRTAHEHACGRAAARGAGLYIRAPATRTTQRFTFGTGKLGDLAGFTSAIILAMIALLIAYEAPHPFLCSLPIHFVEAPADRLLGLAVNVASAWLLSGEEHGLPTDIRMGTAITPWTRRGSSTRRAEISSLKYSKKARRRASGYPAPASRPRTFRSKFCAPTAPAKNSPSWIAALASSR